MALDAVLESLDGLPDAVSEHYEEQEDGTFKLGVTSKNGFALENVTKLKKASRELRTKHEKAKKALSAFDVLKNEDEDELDPDDIVEKLALLATLQEEGGDIPNKIKAGIEAGLKKTDRKHDKDKELSDTEIKSLTKALTKALIGDGSRQAISDHDGIPEALMPIIRGRAKVRKGEDGKHRAVLVDDDGDVMLDDDGDPLGIGGFVKGLSTNDKYGFAFNGTGSTGTGGKQPTKTPRQHGSGQPMKVTRAQVQGDPELQDKIGTGEAVMVD